ncbi:caspase family protein [Planctomicrobium sp. SH527]|uniref:caspase family protein n=1 Tax=Planctomicrobium sp. SH527 TaxID=3448123 RepID=UPI003F5B1183
MNAQRTALLVTTMTYRVTSILILSLTLVIAITGRSGFAQDSDAPKKSQQESKPAAATVGPTGSANVDPAATTSNAPVSTNRGLTLSPESQQETYHSRRAVIIGINYTPKADEKIQAPPLKNAENDAQKIYEILTNHYGFQPENVSLLLGKDATKAAINTQINEKLIDGVTADDCVLFYFSGHGYSRQGTNGNPASGELLPADVEFRDNQPRLSHVVHLDDEVVNALSKFSRARHKLLILDSCYSGTIFSHSGRRAGQFDSLRIDETVFRSPGFQAMTASRELQPAGDAIQSTEAESSRHSPFTWALLNALKYLPAMKGDGAAFTTTQVFSGMQVYLDASLGRGQSPLCSWLDGGQGEFHFFLDGPPPEPERLSEHVRKNMIAMVPGAFGNWWFDECPWFIPALREEIISFSPDSRSINLELISPRQLKDAADKFRNQFDGDTQLSDLTKLRLDHMRRITNSSSDNWEKTIRDIARELEALTSESKIDEQKPIALAAVDLHLLAVLHHALRENTEKIRKSYQNAIASYREAPVQNKALLAMCFADFAWFEADVANEFDQASQYYAEARISYGAITPQPFLVYVLCRDAEAMLRLGREGAANLRLKEALSAIREVDPNEAFQLSAAYYHRRAWLRMYVCKFAEARQDFTRSTEILTPLISADSNSRSGHLEPNSDIDALILVFHNEHGNAMATRFMGNTELAIIQYRRLHARIGEEFQRMSRSEGREVNYRQTRIRLTERLINTQERLGDCTLFGQPSDIAEAADDYRRALRACGYLPSEHRRKFEQRLRYKYALTLALPGNSIRDTEMAFEQLKAAQESDQINVVKPPDSTAPVEDPPIENKSAAAPPAVTTQIVKGDLGISDRSIRLCARLTELLLAIDRETAPSHPAGLPLHESQRQLTTLREELAESLTDEMLNRSLSRDDLEAALFCMKVILQDLKEPIALIDASDIKPARVNRFRDLDLLIGFCRSARRSGMEALPFARPYFDCAIQTLVEMNPTHAKQLTELAFEALHGRPHRKSPEGEISLSIFHCRTASYVFLDVPHGVSTNYKLPANIDAEAIRNAIEENRKLALPAEVYKELSVAAINHTPIMAYWKDPVLKIGQHQPIQVVTNKVSATFSGDELNPLTTLTTASFEVETSAPKIENERFPFQIPDGITLTFPGEQQRPPTENNAAEKPPVEETPESNSNATERPE